MNLFVSVLMDAFFAAIAAIGFSVISNPPRKAIFVAALLAAIGHGLRYYLLNANLGINIDIVSATFIASLTIGFLSIFFAKKIYCPAEVFSFPSLLPMIPGMFAYRTILALIKFLRTDSDILQQGLIIEIFRNGLTVAFIMLALVIGVSLPLFIFHKQSYTMTRVLGRRKTT